MQERLKRIAEENCTEITGDKNRRKIDKNYTTSASRLNDLNNLSVTANIDDRLIKEEEEDEARHQGSLVLLQDQSEASNVHDSIHAAEQREVAFPLSNPLHEKETQNLSYGQLMPNNKQRNYQLYLSNGQCILWKQPKHFYQRLEKIHALSNAQIQLTQLIRDKLIRAFTLCNLIADGSCYDASWVNSSTTLDMAQQAASAGGLLPIVGSTIVFGNLVFSALRTGLKEFNKNSVIKRSELVKEFISDHDEMMTLSGNVAIIAAVVYGEPIAKLSQNGLTVFANYLVNRMIHYVASNNGRDSTYLNTICYSIMETLQGCYNAIRHAYDHSLAPCRDKVQQAKEKTLLDSILCHPPGFTPRTALERIPGYRGNEPYTVEGILTTGIRTPEGECFEDADAESEKYGYRFLSREYAVKMGYMPTDNTIPTTLVSPRF